VYASTMKNKKGKKRIRTKRNWMKKKNNLEEEEE
jgi:hypothetical protein